MAVSILNPACPKGANLRAGAGRVLRAPWSNRRRHVSPGYRQGDTGWSQESADCPQPDINVSKSRGRSRVAGGRWTRRLELSANPHQRCSRSVKFVERRPISIF